LTTPLEQQQILKGDIQIPNLETTGNISETATDIIKRVTNTKLKVSSWVYIKNQKGQTVTVTD